MLGSTKLTRIVVLPILGTLIAIPVYGRDVSVPATLTFSQADLDLDDGYVVNSDWGSVGLSFMGNTDVLYFNLAVNGSWQIQNLPIVSVKGVSQTEEVSCNFSLGVLPGNNVTQLTYGYSLTTDLQPQMPDVGVTAPVSDRKVTMRSGLDLGLIQYSPAAPAVGGQVNAVHKHRNQTEFPNQDCDLRECAPAAISNSLLWLNTVHNLNIDPVFLTLVTGVYDDMDSAGAWVAGVNSPATWNPSDPRAFWNVKDKYVHKTNSVDGRPWPIRTTVTTDPEAAGAALDNDCDVELTGVGHVAAVTSIARQSDGRYAITVVHDTEPGTDGKGTSTEEVILTPDVPGAASLSGGFGFAGQFFLNFIIECPESPDPTMRTTWSGIKTLVRDHK